MGRFLFVVGREEVSSTGENGGAEREERVREQTDRTKRFIYYFLAFLFGHGMAWRTAK